LFEGVYSSIKARDIIWGYEAELANKFNHQNFLSGDGLWYSPWVAPFFPNLEASEDIFNIYTGVDDGGIWSGVIKT
jgi:hypothetical protein